jgi:hypothetical protein
MRCAVSLKYGKRKLLTVRQYKRLAWWTSVQLKWVVPLLVRLNKPRYQWLYGPLHRRYIQPLFDFGNLYYAYPSTSGIPLDFIRK